MICPAAAFSGGHEKQKHWENWVGTVSYDIAEYWEPDSLDDLVRVVVDATDGNHELHAVGSGWAFENLAASDDWIVSLNRLTAKLEYVVDGALNGYWSDRHNDPNGVRRLYHVEAGVEIAILSDMLAADGLAMRTLGGANGQTLVGAVSTSTHGGDISLPPLPDLVRAIHVVTAGGKELWIERASDPITVESSLRPVLPCADTEIIYDDELFDAAVVSVGRFGVIYAVVIEVRTAFRLAEWTVRRSTETIFTSLTDGIGAKSWLGPLLESLPDPPDALNAKDDPGPTRFLQILFNSQDPTAGLITRRWLTDDEQDLALDQNESTLCAPGVANAVLLLAASILEWSLPVLLAIPIVGLFLAARAIADAAVLTAHALNPHLTGGEALALSVNALWHNNLGMAVPHLGWAALNGQFAASQQTGRRGPSHIVMTGTREINQSDCYRGDSLEVIFSGETADYIDFLREIFAVATTFHQCGYVSLRYTAPSEALLSMHNIPARFVVSIEVASIKGIEDNDAWLRFVEGAAITHGGRLHWGQVNHLTEDKVLALYQGNLIRWREALLSASGTSTLFSNDYTRMRGLEPAGILRRVTRTRKPGGVITHLCGEAGDRWSPIAVQDAIRQIEQGSVIYFTGEEGSTFFAPLQVIDDPNGKYLRSSPDHTKTNNLDVLPDC